MVNGAVIGLITNMDFTIERAQEAANVIASNTAADIFVGKIRATGSLSVYFTDPVWREYLSNETEISILVALSASNDKAADCVSFCFPRVKTSSSEKADAELGITQSVSWTALLNSNTATGLPATTVQIGDTGA